ncbi:MAG: hypothetical protein IT435_08355 [Phycisphaerales bacterium]|nr:hypothetical protein [Phycisphaerales bacterium]
MGVSPADGEIVGLKANCPPGGDFLMPASFYYSAAMFNSWSEYDFTATSNPCCPSPYGPMYRGDCCDPLKNCEPVACGVGSAQMEQITFPDSKVVLAERADFMKPSRSQSLGNGKTKDRPLPPAWNNPRSKPHTAMADGSVATANMTILTLAAADSIKNDAGLAMVPVDLFAAPDRLHSVGHDGYAVIDLTGETDDLYPYFFAGTRYGVRGRDLNNEARK